MHCRSFGQARELDIGNFTHAAKNNVSFVSRLLSLRRWHNSGLTDTFVLAWMDVKDEDAELERCGWFRSDKREWQSFDNVIRTLTNLKYA